MKLSKHIMPFPNEYKKALEKGTKTITIRMSDEQGKYKPGETYIAGSYSNKPWNYIIHIINVKTTKAKNVPKIRELKSLNPNDKVDVIKFQSMPKDIYDYIKKYVKHPKDNCFFYTAALKIQFPFLKLMKGPPQLPGETAHFFLTNNSTIIDPTIQQYDFQPNYSPATELSIEKNIDFLINHPLFKTLPKNTQRQAMKMYKKYF